MTDSKDIDSSRQECPAEGCEETIDRRGIVSHLHHKHGHSYDEARELAGINDDDTTTTTTTTTPHSIVQDEEIRELERQIEIQKRENELARLRGERDDLEDRLDSLQGELAQMRQELDEMRNNSVDRDEIRELIADETTDPLTEDEVTELIRQHRRMFRPTNDDTVQAIARTIADKAVMFEWEVFCQECNRWGVPREPEPETFQCRYCGTSLWQTGWIPIK